VGHRTRRGLAVLLIVAASACAGDGEDPSGSSGAPESTATSGPPAGDGSCAWATRADEDTSNIAYPDTAATYWGLSYDLAEGEGIELRGRMPGARYASFITYRVSGGAIDVLTDRDIEPDEGHTNPFAGEVGDDDHAYTVVITADGVGRNTLAAADTPPSADAGDGATTTSRPPVTLPPGVDPPRLLGQGGGQGVRGTVLYRVYVPDDPEDPTGGTGLPDVSVVSADGTITPVPTCPEPGPSPVGEALVETYGPPTDRPAPPQPIFVRPAAGAANLFPNPDNVYIASIASHMPGRVVVVRGLAPTFADPAEGRPVGGGEQVRYWSICTDEYRKPYPVSFCVFDRQVVLDDDGWYTIVISTPEDRPANASEADGVTWLEWGATEVDNLILLRHMLASPDFAESAINVEPGALAQSTMGDYTPQGVYCDRVTFEDGGADACAAEMPSS
jgi:hypothetical protein